MAVRLHSSDSDFAENHEINVTPFVDVMLVLLIIFIIAAPLATVDVPLDLPVSSATASEPAADPVTLSIQADLQLRVGERPVTHADLGPALDRVTQGNKKSPIFLRADKRVAYGDLMQVMDGLRAAGYLKVALVGLEASR